MSEPLIAMMILIFIMKDESNLVSSWLSLNHSHQWFRQFIINRVKLNILFSSCLRVFVAEKLPVSIGGLSEKNRSDRW